MSREMTETEKEIRAGGHYTDEMNGVAVEKTTFWLDFSIADKFGASAVRDTYKRAFGEWKDDIRYMTALCIVLNHKIWQHYELENGVLARVYDELWKECDGFILECENAGTQAEKYINFTSDEISYFIQATD